VLVCDCVQREALMDAAKALRYHSSLCLFHSSQIVRSGLVPRSRLLVVFEPLAMLAMMIIQ
jgi:hypothetical protein